MSRNHRLSFFLVLGLVLPTALAAADDDPLVAAARTRYDQPHWPAGARRAGFDLGRHTLPRLVGDDVEPDAAGGRVLRRYLDAAGKPALLVELRVAEQVAEAQEVLLGHVAHLQSTKLLPRTADRGVRAGDIGFIGYSGEDEARVAWLAFVVGNVEFRVVNLDRTGAEPRDVFSAAESLAAAAGRAPLLAEGPLPRPVVERFAAERAECRMGERVVLDLAVADPAGGAALLEFEVHGPGQGYVERGADGRYGFHATNAGAVRLVLHALGANGTYSRGEVALQVAED